MLGEDLPDARDDAQTAGEAFDRATRAEKLTTMGKNWEAPRLHGPFKPRPYNPDALLDDSVIDGIVAEAVSRDADPLPSETAVYARLASTMLDAMRRAKLTEAQQDIVTNAFHDTTLALMLDAQRAGVVSPEPTKEEAWANARATMAEHERALHDAGLSPYAPVKRPKDPDLCVVLDVRCMACRRDLGQALIPASAAPHVERIACPGCEREGRGHKPA